MIGVFCFLSLVASGAVLPAAALDLEAARMGGAAFLSGPATITETKFMSAETRPTASGRSLWAAEETGSSWGSEAKAGSGRAVSWTDAAAMTAEKQVGSGRSLWRSEDSTTSASSMSSGASAFAARGMASGRSLWNSDTKMASPSGWKVDEKLMSSGRHNMAAAGRAAWKSESTHMHKDAQPAIPILQQEYEMSDPASYMYTYKTANGIAAQEQAAMKSGDAEAVQGVYSWVAPSGEKFAVEYLADETGYHAKGAHIPEMPRAIARSLEWNAAHPEEENDGAYESESTSWSSSGAKTAESSWTSAKPAYSSAKMGVASGRSSWQSESSEALPTWKSASRTVTAAPSLNMASARSAWVAEDSAALPTWESSAKVAAASSARGWDSAASQMRASSWMSADGALTDGGMRRDGLGAVKITETYKQGAASGPVSGLVAAGRSAWKSEPITVLGATRITESKTIGYPSPLSTASSFASASHL